MRWSMGSVVFPCNKRLLPRMLALVRDHWAIERLFRLWKEHGQIDEWRSKNPWRILAEFYGKLAAMLIQQWLIHEGCWQDPWRSLVKAAAVVRREANRIMVAFVQGGLEAVLRSIVRCMRSGCQLERHQGHPSTAQLLLEGLDWHLNLMRMRHHKGCPYMGSTSIIAVFG
jgi:hypothetical protein